jgi:predicted TIM-barrel fold metal-dependent hydrolase
MPTSIRRVVDAHVHLWDPARTDWYPYLSGRRELNMGDISGMCRLFDQPTYFAESAAWRVEKIVHVAAASAEFLAEETRELDDQASTTGHPDAIVGGLNPSLPLAEALDLLDRHMASPRFRGVRVMGAPGYTVPSAELLEALEERNLVFDLMCHPAELHTAAASLASFGDLTVVVEHTGWPTSNSNDEYELWKSGMAALAAMGPRINCKLSGLAMPMGSMDAGLFKPWIDYCIEKFGVDRCMFASNFPVDGNHGSFDELFTTYDRLTQGLDDDSRDKLFAANAERVYRC